ELDGAEPYRLESAAEQRAGRLASQLPQAGAAECGPAEGAQQRLRPVDADQADAVLQGNVAEQQVEALAQLGTDGGERIRDAGTVAAVAERRELVDAADDASTNVVVDAVHG